MSEVANMRIVMLTHAENQYYSAYYPSNTNNEIISEIKSINEIYKGQQNGL